MAKNKKQSQTPTKTSPSKKTNAQNAKGLTRNRYVALSAILLITFLAYLPALSNGFINLDDDKYIVSNPLICHINFKEIFSQYVVGNYHPLTMLVYALEYHFFAINEKAYHAVNLAIHLLNVILVFRVILLLSKNANVALITSLLFGIHPLHVESVAWASELKDLLYAFFFLASYLFYLQFTETNKKRFYFYALLLFACSLLSKAMAAPLPVLLLLTDYYKERKINTKVWLEKAPFFVIAILLGVIAVFAQKTSGYIQDITYYPFFYRIVFACYSFITYLQKLLVPIHLAVYYPYPGKDSMPLYYYIYTVLFAALAAAVLYSLRYTRIIAFGIGFFAVTIFLVLQLLPVGGAIMAERYTYVASIGILYLIGKGLYFLWSSKSSLSFPKSLVLLLGSVLIVFLSFKTYARCKVWNNSLTLMNDLLDQFKIPVGYNNRGLLLAEKERFDEALDDFNNAVKLQPDVPLGYNNRGLLYKAIKKYDEAHKDFDKAIAIQPDFYQALTNKGILFSDQKSYDEALKYYNRSIEVQSNYANSYYFRGFTLALLNRSKEALSDYEKVIQLEPHNGEAFYNKAILEYNLGRKNETCADLLIAARLGYQLAENAQRDLCH